MGAVRRYSGREVAGLSSRIRGDDKITSLSLLKIIIDDAQVGERWLLAVHARFDHAAADGGRRLVPEVIGCFKHGSRGVQGAAIVLRRIGLVCRLAALAAKTL